MTPLDDLLNKLETDISDVEKVEALAKAESRMRASEDWSGLQEAYNAVLETLPEDFPATVQATLWEALGDIYRDQLADNDGARNAYDKAKSHDPDRDGLADRLASVAE